MSAAPVIQVENLTKYYRRKLRGGRPALDQVTLAVPRGAIFGFLGPNGAGKTTLIKILVGIMAPTSGRCRIVGRDGTARDCDTRDAKLSLGYFPERPYFHEFLTAEEFLLFHGGLLGMSNKEVKSRIAPLLKRVGLTRARDQKLKTFSKGMLQRIGMAQALLHDPDLLILDEPMSGLDPVGRREVRDIITEIGASGKTIFFSTHIIHDVEVICTAVGFIKEGKLQGLGNIESLLGKTVKSMEIRFDLGAGGDPSGTKHLQEARRTLDGWVLTVESAPDRLEADVNRALAEVLSGKGSVRSVVPRKSTLEDLFFGDAT